MTIWDLLARAGRRWYIVLSCVALTALMLVAVMAVPPVYSARVRVVLFPPEIASPNPYTSTTSSLVAFAGAVERSINGEADGSQASSTTVTLVGTGLRHGSSISIPNSGGQWGYKFDEPALDVEVVSESAESASRQMESELAQVFSAIDQLQDEQDVPATLRFRTQLSPTEPEVLARSGSDLRAILAVLAVGALGTLLLLSRGRELPVTSVDVRGRRAAQGATSGG
jgi:hypothetical protein